jgi:hypothetical protein
VFKFNVTVETYQGKTLSGTLEAAGFNEAYDAIYGTAESRAKGDLLILTQTANGAGHVPAQTVPQSNVASANVVFAG